MKARLVALLVGLGCCQGATRPLLAQAQPTAEDSKELVKQARLITRSLLDIMPNSLRQSQLRLTDSPFTTMILDGSLKAILVLPKPGTPAYVCLQGAATALQEQPLTPDDWQRLWNYAGDRVPHFAAQWVEHSRQGNLPARTADMQELAKSIKGLSKPDQDAAADFVGAVVADVDPNPGDLQSKAYVAAYKSHRLQELVDNPGAAASLEKAAAAADKASQPMALKGTAFEPLNTLTVAAGDVQPITIKDKPYTYAWHGSDLVIVPRQVLNSLQPEPYGLGGLHSLGGLDGLGGPLLTWKNPDLTAFEAASALAAAHARGTSSGVTPFGP